MNIPGPLSISTVNAPHQAELDLRPFQRVTAQVLTIAGTTALLSIEGYPVVAQLASSDQASALLPQQTAQFIVTQRTAQNITLKLVQNDQSPVSWSGPITYGPEIALRLLGEQNIPVTANHLIVARAVLKKHLPLTPQLLNELLGVLSEHGTWGSKEAELAVALKAAGLPLNAESLALASRQAAQIGDSLARLIAKLSRIVDQDLPEDLLKSLSLSMQMLESTIVKVDGETSQLAEQLKATIQLLGRSLESDLLEQSQNAEGYSIEKSLSSLTQLQQKLEQAGKNELAATIAEFLRDLQWNHFLNAKPDPSSGQAEWSEVGFAVQSAQKQTGEGFSSARLRIAHESSHGINRINPAYTRLILQVELGPDQTVEVDLSVVDKQIRTTVTAPDPVWCQQAQEELPALESALQGLGYILQATQIDIGEPRPFEHLTMRGAAPLLTVDIEA